jgi:hypothetical protein
LDDDHTPDDHNDLVDDNHTANDHDPATGDLQPDLVAGERRNAVWYEQPWRLRVPRRRPNIRRCLRRRGNDGEDVVLHESVGGQHPVEYRRNV